MSNGYTHKRSSTPGPLIKKNLSSDHSEFISDAEMAESVFGKKRPNSDIKQR